MFGLASLPLTQRFLHKFDMVQRRMLRLLVGFAYLVNLGKTPWGEWTKEWNTLRIYIHCRPGGINILKANTAWQPRLFPINLPGLLQPLLGCLWMIGCTTFHPHHPEAEPDRRKGGIRHSLRFHVHILASETGGWQPQNCNQWLAAEAAFVKYCESMWRTKGSPCPSWIEVTRTGERKKGWHDNSIEEHQSQSQNSFAGL